MDDKIYRGPGHPVGAHFHSGPKGERGLPGVSPKVDMTYNEDDGTVVFTVSDGYGQREQTVPMAELMALDFAAHDLSLYLDTHPGDTEAFETYKQLLALAKEGEQRYVERYGPICKKDLANSGTFRWLQGPWPWELPGERRA